MFSTPFLVIQATLYQQAVLVTYEKSRKLVSKGIKNLCLCKSALVYQMEARKNKEIGHFPRYTLKNFYAKVSELIRVLH